MSTRILPLAAALVALATAAAAQTPPAKDQPAPGLELGSAVQPVMDREVVAHLLFNELEGRFNGSNAEFRWEGQGWVGTDYDKLWIKSEGALQGNGTLDDGQHQFLYSRAITT
jgi:copper resistance protein B